MPLVHAQGLFIAILQAAGSIATVEDGKNLQNLLVCLEMLPAALGMLVAFPYTEYKGSGKQADKLMAVQQGRSPFLAVLACCMLAACSESYMWLTSLHSRWRRYLISPWR